MKDADIRTAVLMDVMAENVDVIYENSPYELILMEDEESGMADEYIIADKQCDEDGNYVSSDERLKYLSMLFIEQEVDGVVYLEEGEVGDIVRVRITDTLVYEMEGDVVHGS